MTLIAHVCAEFCDAHRNPIYTITQPMLNDVLYDVPDAIRADPLFAMLIAEGSLKAVESAADRKAAEKDPLAGITAEGRKKRPAKAKAADSASGPDSRPESPAEEPPSGSEVASSPENG